MNQSKLSAALRATFHIVVRIATWIFKCISKFPSATTCLLVGTIATYGLSCLPGWLGLSWYLGAAATAILFVRGAWTDLTVTSSENRIAARTMDAVARATNKDQA